MHMDHQYMDSENPLKTGHLCLKDVVDPLPLIPTQQKQHIANSIYSEAALYNSSHATYPSFPIIQ